MDKATLLQILQEAEQHPDPERGHQNADAALLAFINDPEIAAAWHRVERWYA